MMGDTRRQYDARWFGATSDDLKDCPRKMEYGAGDPAESSLKLVRDFKGEWREEGTCSWCGSLKPSIFFQALDDGAVYGATDKNYKAYLHGPEAPQVPGAAKMYFQHFDAADRQRFYDLHVAGVITFYVMPFFLVAPANEAEGQGA